MNYALASTLINSFWAVSPDFAQTVLPMAIQLLKGENLQLQGGKERIEAQILASDFSAQAYNNEHTVERGVVIISHDGIMLREDQPCGPTGTTYLAEQINKATEDPRVAGIILKLNTPGGSVYSVQKPTEAMQKLKAANKPIYAISDSGTIASAGYWLACNATGVFAKYDTDSFGSIGVRTTIPNIIKKLKSEGLDVHEVFADKSIHKDGGINKLFNGDDSEIKAQLNVWNEKFHSIVKANRTVNEKVFTAKMYMAAEAIEMGLIDGMATEQELVNKILNGSGSATGTQANNNTPINMFKKQTKATAYVAMSAEERTPEALAAANAELNAEGLILIDANEQTPDYATMESHVRNMEANTELVGNLTKAFGAAANAEGFNLSTAVANAIAASNTLASVIQAFGEAASAENFNPVAHATELVSENARMSALVPGAGANPPKEGKDAMGSSADSEREKLLASMPHNQTADNL